MFEAIESISVAIAAVVAIWSIYAWRKEFLGKRRIELAEEVLALFYEAADVIRYMRSGGYEGEGMKSRRVPADETPKQKSIREQAFIPFAIYNDNKEPFSRLRALRFRFMALFGRQAGEPFDKLNKIVGEILVSARILARLWENRDRQHHRTDVQMKKELERIDKHEAKFFSGMDDGPDKMEIRLEGVLSDIEKVCRPIIIVGR